MRKSILSALLLTAVLFGCQQENESDLGNISSRRSSKIEIIGKIVSPETRTTLDGLVIRWAENDAIGVFSSTERNVKGTLVSSSAGSTEGLFSGMFSGGTPTSAYYPYTAGATCTKNSVTLTLPPAQEQSGSGPDMNYDVKAGRFVSGNVIDKYKFEFKEKLSLLNFVLLPGSDLDGDHLQSISFTATGRALAGTYTMGLSNIDAALSFASDYSSTVTLSFTSSPALSAAVNTDGWMFVNPAVASGDALEIKVRTDNHLVTVNVAASKAYLAGYKYNMPLDIAALVASGKATVSSTLPAYDITTLTDAGVFDMANGAYTCKYEAGVNQYALYTKTVSSQSRGFYRVQSLPGGYAVEMSAPASLSLNDEVAVTVTAYGTTPVAAGSFTATVVKVNADMVWLSDAEHQTGYIMMRR
ncbi:MAG: fimbrillin family protein [Bacteroidales bacterium]|nr:fimbrillin family protein [Bacteroidales bacterium]